LDWNEYIIVAKTLCENSTEAHSRSAISRAYYALYNQAKNWYMKDAVRRSEGLPRGESSHENLWKYFQKLGGDYGKIGNNGSTLRRHRNDCDYQNKVGSKLILQNPLVQVKCAEQTIELLKTLK
jgi:hypothetical protein